MLLKQCMLYSFYFLSLPPPLTPHCANSGTLWHVLFTEIVKIFKRAILTLGINVRKETNQKKYSYMVF